MENAVVINNRDFTMAMHHVYSLGFGATVHLGLRNICQAATHTLAASWQPG